MGRSENPHETTVKSRFEKLFGDSNLRGEALAEFMLLYDSLTQEEQAATITDQDFNTFLETVDELIMSTHAEIKTKGVEYVNLLKPGATPYHTLGNLLDSQRSHLLDELKNLIHTGKVKY